MHEQVASPTYIEVTKLVVDAANITSLKFGKDAKYIAAGSQDSKLLLFSSPKNDDLMNC